MHAVLAISPYDPAWPETFNREQRRISAALHDLALRIDHVGSTSVPGLPAKPIIDIQISVRTLHPLAPYLAPLAELGYVHVAHADDSFCPFFHRPATNPHSHHIHLVEAGGGEERRVLALRDYLRDHPVDAEAYAAVKRRIAPGFRIDQGDDYNAAKSAFIAELIERALAAGYPRA